MSRVEAGPAPRAGSQAAARAAPAGTVSTGAAALASGQAASGPPASARDASSAAAPESARRGTGRLRARFHAWLEARHERTDTLLLTQANVYILPTRAGFMFGLTILVLLLASINYQLNLGHVLAFLLAGSGVVSMHVTHATLRGLTLHLKPAAPGHAGDALGLELVLTSPDRARYGVGLRLAGAPEATLAWIDVPAGGQASAHVAFVPARRGRVDAPTLGVETRFPLGLFRAWAVWRPASSLLVYPRLEQPAAPLPAARPSPGGASQQRTLAGGDVEGVRAYRRGDPLQLIAWKKSAKAMEAGGELVSRDTSASMQRELWLDWQACGALAPEDRLSRLAAWVVAAQRAGADIGLDLPGASLAPAGGDAHRHRCLEVLAVWHA